VLPPRPMHPLRPRRKAVPVSLLIGDVHEERHDRDIILGHPLHQRRERLGEEVHPLDHDAPPRAHERKQERTERLQHQPALSLVALQKQLVTMKR